MVHTILSKVKHVAQSEKSEYIISLRTQVKGQGTLIIWKIVVILGQRTGNINNIASTNSPGQKTGQILSYNLKNQSQETGCNTSI